MTSALAHIHSPAPTLTTRQLATHLGRSERWVQLRVRDGMPSLPPTQRFASRRFVLSDVQAWLDGGRPSVLDRDVRLACLEREVVSLRSRVSELEDLR